MQKNEKIASSNDQKRNFLNRITKKIKIEVT